MQTATKCHGKPEAHGSFHVGKVAEHLAVRVEKYRPQELKDVVGNRETIDRLQVIAQDGNMPHIIISVSINTTLQMSPLRCC